jgi:methoxymalonate biosynthesis acyl carrier protein
MAAGNVVHDAIVTIFKNKLEFEIPGAETDLLETGMMDSLKFVELLFHLEQEFGITISIGTLELDQFRNIANIVQFVEGSKKVNGTNTPLC